jgi:hypothetical protein
MTAPPSDPLQAEDPPRHDPVRVRGHRVSERARLWYRDETAVITEVVERLLDVCLITVQCPLYRAVFERYLNPADGSAPEPLYYRGSLAGGRFTPRKGPAGLYLSYDPSTPLAELRVIMFGDGASVSSVEHDPIVAIAVRATVHHVLDLTDAAVRRRLDLTPRELAADWLTQQGRFLAGDSPMPATQLLALAAHTSRLVTAIRYPSTRSRIGRNLVVFPDRLDRAAGDLLEVVDSTDRYRQRLP